MNELFLKIVNMSISASWLILAVLLLRLVFKKAPKWVSVLLWGIVAVRLLCPFTIESAMSLIPSAETIPMDIEMDTTPAINSGVNGINRVVNPVISQSNTPANGASVNPLQVTIAVCANIWILGAAALLIHTAVSYLRLRRRVDTAVRLRDNIFQSENVSSPFVLGILKPRIYLPFKLDGQELEHVIAHERAHIGRRDHWWKPLGFLLLTVHWFNPLMWLAYLLLCRDIELACDEKVIKTMDSERRADYTQALLACSVNHRMIAACPLAFGEVGVKERVKSVMNYKKPAFWVIIAAVISCSAVAVCFLTDPSVKHDSLVWAQGLSAEEIQSADLVVFPQAEDKQFKKLSSDELFSMTALVSQSSGKYQDDHEELDGGSIFFYITMKDGTTHSVGNIGNTYLVIDGDYYEAEYEWLVTWDNEFGEGNAPLPDGYFDRRANSAVKWFDYTDDPSQMDWDNEITTELPEFPGVTFRYTAEQIVASKAFEGTDLDGHAILIAGMPIWSAYFYDLTGDGLPEICASLSMGSGIIDNRVIVHDYANGMSYELADRGFHDYYLRINTADGCLYADKRVYTNGELISSGPLVLNEDVLQIAHSPAAEPGAEKWDLIPMVMVNGVLYLDTGYESAAIYRNDGFDGEISSQVDGSEKPYADDQSNFGTGYGYQSGSREGTIEIFINGKWWIYATEEARREIQFPESFSADVIDAVSSIDVFNMITGKTLTITANEDLQTVTDRLSGDGWVKDIPACDNDFELTINGRTYLYHSDCRTFTDVYNNISKTVDNGSKAEINIVLTR